MFNPINSLNQNKPALLTRADNALLIEEISLDIMLTTKLMNRPLALETVLSLSSEEEKDVQAKTSKIWKDLEERVNCGRNILHLIGMMGDRYPLHIKDLIQKAINEGCSLNERGPVLNRTPLLWAIANAQNYTAMTLLDYEIEVDAQDLRYLNSALILAVGKGSTDIVRKLLECGADPDLQERGGNTALHFAYARKDTAMINILIQFGANQTIQNNTGKTPDEMEMLNY